MRTEVEWRRSLLAVAQQWTENFSDAEDIVQEVLLRFWLSANLLPWEHSDEAFAKAACRRLIRFVASEFHRRKSKEPRLLSLEALAGDAIVYTPEESFLDNLTCRQVLQQLYAVLSSRQRQVLALLEQGFTHSEISNIIGLHIGTVKRHHERICQKAAALMSTRMPFMSELVGVGGNY